MTTTATIPRAAAGERLEQRPWHAESADEAIRALESRPEGLAEHEVPARLERFGPNRLPQPEARSALARFLAQFDNLLIYVLIGAAVVSGAPSSP